MADLICIAVSLALAGYYLIRLYKFFPAQGAGAHREVQGDYEDTNAPR